MGSRYYLTGVQWGLLAHFFETTEEDKKMCKEILEEIYSEQYLGEAQDKLPWWTEKPKHPDSCNMELSQLRNDVSDNVTGQTVKGANHIGPNHCIMLKDNKCNSDYYKGKDCDGINAPEDCPYKNGGSFAMTVHDWHNKSYDANDVTMVIEGKERQGMSAAVMSMAQGFYATPKHPMAKTKFYVTIDRLRMSDKLLYFFFFTQGIWVNSITKIGEFNYIVNVDYNNEDTINKLIGNHKCRAVNFQVRRIFKSMRIIPAHKGEPTQSFLNELIILASSRIKGINIKVVSNTKESNKWQQALLKQWQEELDHPKKFKELNIKPEMDIAPDGKLKLHITVIGKYVITYFDEDISKYYIRPKGMVK